LMVVGLGLLSHEASLRNLSRFYASNSSVADLVNSTRCRA